jgi:hypothetical protein
MTTDPLENIPERLEDTMYRLRLYTHGGFNLREPGPLVVQCALGAHSSTADGVHFLTWECMGEGEWDDAMDLLQKELEEVRLVGKQAYRRDAEQKRRWREQAKK